MKFKMFIYVKVQKTLAKSDKAKITFLWKMKKIILNNLNKLVKGKL